MFYNLLHCCRNLESMLVIYDLFAASEPSSAFSPKACRRHYFDFSELFRRNHVADVFGLFVKNHVADLILFDVDSEHEDHSEELLLFVGCIVNFIVSYLICMFQDSVPAGSYNDPFLSSVCVWVCVCVTSEQM